jgi:hypothetical protein
MWIYLFIFSFVAFCGFFEVLRIERKVKWTLMLMAYILLALFSGLRGGVGYDYDTYEEIFDLAGNLSDWFNFGPGTSELHGEPGFLLIAQLHNTLGLSFNIFLLFFAFVTMFAIYKMQQKYGTFILAGLMIYVSRFYLFREFGQIRAGLAIAILVYGTSYLSEKRIRKYFLFIFIAALFHTIALLGIIFFFFNKIKITTRNLYILLGSAFILGSVNWLLLFLPLFELIFPATTFAAYFLWDMYAYTLGLTNPVLLAQTGFLLLFYHKRKILRSQILHYDIILKAYLFSTLWLAAFNQVAIIAGRTATVYATFEMIIVPSFVMLIKEKYIAYIMIVLYAAAIYILNLNKDFDVFVPYKTFLQ